MFYNHNRQTVGEWDNGPSLCPECRSPLVAHRGDIVAWHWAHKPSTHTRKSCPFEESRWHLLMKTVYLAFQNWEIEVPVKIGAKTYRVDAIRPSNNKIREFVHSLSPYYIEKHITLANAGYKVLWILDGDKFVSKRARYTRRSSYGVRGIHRFLKPAAADLCASLTKHVMVHYDNQLWKEWKNGVWYPNDSDTTKDLTRLYQEADAIAKEMYQPTKI